MTKKQMLKSIGFLSLLCIILYFVNELYGMPDEQAINKLRYQTMYTEEEDTWDGILLGTSVVDRAWAAPLAYSQTGATLYPLSTDSQPIGLTTYVIEEVLKRQDLDLVVVDLHGIRSNGLNMKDSSLRRIVDCMPLSTNKIAAIQYGFSFSAQLGGKADKLKNKDIWDYYIPFFKYHAREDITIDDLFEQEDILKGVNTKYAFRAVKQYNPLLITDTAQLSELQQNLLLQIISYCKEKGLSLLFISVPSYLTIQEQQELNAAFDFVKEAGCDTLNMNTVDCYEDIEINYKKDFYNNVHLNSKGAKKVTTYLASYIAAQYDLTDHRGDTDYVDWDEAYENYDDFYTEGWE